MNAEGYKIIQTNVQNQPGPGGVLSRERCHGFEKLVSTHLLYDDARAHKVI